MSALRGRRGSALQEGRQIRDYPNLSGHGHCDTGAYIAYFEGRLTDQDYDEGELATALARLPSIAA